MIKLPDMAGFPSPPRRTPSRTSLSSLQSDRSQGPPPTRPRKSSRRVRKDGGTMSSGSESMGRGDSQQSASSGAETSGIDSDGGRSPLPSGLAGGRFVTSQWTASQLEAEDDREALVASTSQTISVSPTPSPHRVTNELLRSQTPNQVREMAMGKRQRTFKGKSIDIGSRDSIASLASVLSSGGESVYEDAMTSMDEDDENYSSHRRSLSKSMGFNRSLRKRSSSSLKIMTKSSPPFLGSKDDVGTPPSPSPAPQSQLSPSRSTMDHLRKRAQTVSTPGEETPRTNSRTASAPSTLVIDRTPSQAPLSPRSSLMSTPTSTVIPIRRFSSITPNRNSPPSRTAASTTTPRLRRNSTQTGARSGGAWHPKPLVLTPARTVTTPLTSSSSPIPGRRAQSAMGEYSTQDSVGSLRSPRWSTGLSAGRPASPFGFGHAGPTRRRSLGYIEGPAVTLVRNRDSASSNSASHYRLSRYRSQSEETGLTRSAESPDSSVNDWSEGERDKSVEGSPRESEWDDGRKSGGTSSLKVVEEGMPISSWGDIAMSEEGVADNNPRGSSALELVLGQDGPHHDWTAIPPVIELSLPSPTQGNMHRNLNSRPAMHSRPSIDNDADDEHEVLHDTAEAPMSPPPTFPLPGLPHGPELFYSPTSGGESDVEPVGPRRMPGDERFGSGYDDFGVSPSDTQSLSSRTSFVRASLPPPISLPTKSTASSEPPTPPGKHNEVDTPSPTAPSTPALSPSPVPLGTPIIIKSRGPDGTRHSRYSDSSSKRTRSFANSPSSEPGSPYKVPDLPQGSRSRTDLVTSDALNAAYGPQPPTVVRARSTSSSHGHNLKSPVRASLDTAASSSSWKEAEERRNKAVPGVPAVPFEIPARKQSMSMTSTDVRTSRASTTPSVFHARGAREARDPRTQIDRPDPIMRELLSMAPPFPSPPARNAPRVSISTASPKIITSPAPSATPKKKGTGSRLRSRLLPSFLATPKHDKHDKPAPTPDLRSTPPRPVRPPSLQQSILVKGNRASNVDSLRSLDHTMPAFQPGSPLNFNLSVGGNSLGSVSARAHNQSVERLSSHRRDSVSSDASSMRAPPKPFQLPPGLAAGVLPARAHATEAGKPSQHLQYVIPTRGSSAGVAPSRSPRLDSQDGRISPRSGASAKANNAAIRDAFRSQFLER